MGEIIGRAACPICGNTVAVKINKNRKLYAFCDYSCKFSLNSEMSRHGIAELAAGRMVTLGKLIIKPTERNNENGTETTTGTTPATRIDAGQWTRTATATPGTTAGNAGGTAPAPAAAAAGISELLGL